MDTIEEDIAIGHLVNYLILKGSKRPLFQIIRSYGAPYNVNLSESGNLFEFIRYFYFTDVDDFADVMTILVNNYD